MRVSQSCALARPKWGWVLLDFVSSVATAYLGYASAIVTGLAWPIAIVALAFAFRRRLSELSGKLEKLVFPGGEAHFHQKLPEAEAAAAKTEVAIEAMAAPGPSDEPRGDLESGAEPIDEAQPPATKRRDTGANPDEIVMSLVSLNPTLAVNYVWAQIQGQLKDLRENLSDYSLRSDVLMLSSLRHQGLIPDEAFSLYWRLSQLSGVAAAGGFISADDGYRFISTAKVLQRALAGAMQAVTDRKRRLGEPGSSQE